MAGSEASDGTIGKFDILATYTYAKGFLDGLNDDGARERGMASATMAVSPAEPAPSRPMVLDQAEIAGPKTMPLGIFTIGHSTHPLDRFLTLLSRHGIEALADIRRFPGSRKYPHFHRDDLASSLPQAGVEYRWFEALGGRRKRPGGPTRNLGLRNESFRNYADYMATAAFHEAVGQLLELARRERTAFMCSEGLYWRCHRRLVSDFLLVRGIKVQHIMPSGELRPHVLTAGATLNGEELIYLPPQADQTPSLFE